MFNESTEINLSPEFDQPLPQSSHTKQLPRDEERNTGNA
jgi:hypothetical protein